MDRSNGRRKPISPLKEHNSKKKNLLKRHIDTSSPDPEPWFTDSYIKKKKRCIKPVWSTSKHTYHTETSDTSSSDDDCLGVRIVTQIKSEPPSQEGSLEPYQIKPMLDIPKKKHTKTRKHKSKEYTTRADVELEVTAVTLPTLPTVVERVESATPAAEPVKSALDIPVLGLSTFKITGDRYITQAIDAALQYGYRLFDTGAHYRNQRELGTAFRDFLPKHGLDREDIYILSKLDPSCRTYEDAMQSAECTLNNLQTDYLDVVLLYWPYAKNSSGIDPGNVMIEIYRALEDLYNAGKVRDIGVYKFSSEQLTYLLRRCCVVPAMLQAEFHPYLYRQDLIDICRANSIRMQAFCFIKVVDDPVIVELSRKYRKAPAQIILRWIVQHGVGVLPKSKTPSHIQQNAEIFDFSLDPSDVDWINSLNKDQSFTPNFYK